MVSERSFENVTDGERNTDPDWTFANDDLEKTLDVHDDTSANKVVKYFTDLSLSKTYLNQGEGKHAFAFDTLLIGCMDKWRCCE